MSTAYVREVKCGHCKGSHSDAVEVKACATRLGVFGTAPVEQFATFTNGWPSQIYNQDPATPYHLLKTMGATPEQIGYINDLSNAEEAWRARLLTSTGASHRITQLRKEQRAARHKMIEENSPKTQPSPYQGMKLNIPVPMIQALTDGYYAAQQDDDHKTMFFRVSRLKAGVDKGMIKVQTRHGDTLKTMLRIFPDGKVFVHDKRAETELLLVCVDPNGAMIDYAQKLGQCCRCGKSLTDERSRWYGIGPECEMHLPHIIALVADRKGHFGS
jgi:hypothetical protein